MGNEKQLNEDGEVEAASGGTSANDANGEAARDPEVCATNARESRRRFLQHGAMAGGGLVLGLTSRGAIAQEADKVQSDKTQADKAQDDIVMKLGDHKELSSVGGTRIIETSDDKIIVARVGEAKFVACSAICTHKGCQVIYEHASREFVCPCHKARYALDGAVLRGPAKAPLKSYATDTAAVVALKKK